MYLYTVNPVSTLPTVPPATGTEFDLIWQLLVPFLMGGIVRFVRYWEQVKKKEFSIMDALKAVVSGGITAIVGVSVFNPTGTPFQILVISAFTGIAWVMSRSEISPQQEKNLLNELDAEEVKEVRNKSDEDLSKLE
ncbi:hypothetical protein [Metabacillus fastidiosus]|uniref:hypothetical protein n=1 Tax=Metabacillus fastidiosus TaxID=1458 RepID=UPI000827123C|nr:hypothetical protein [Metabacillus fastidiosus]